MQKEIKEQLEMYTRYLEAEEKSRTTKEQYLRDIRNFLHYKGEQAWSKELVIRYKEQLCSQYQPTSVNVKIAALNSFFSFIGKEMLNVKYLKIQQKAYCSKEKELSKTEYMRLLETAQRRANKKLYLLLQTICGTGIRVSEVRFITVEAVCLGEATVNLKGKTRKILLPGKLKKALKDYIRRAKIKSGPVFVTKNGNPLDRSNIWKMMKALCAEADVEKEKVFPHNLRHLFARCFYAIDRDIARLADILGHSNINTTRIYIISSGQEHRKRLETLRLVI